MAGAGLIDLDSRVFLINMYGTFGNAYGHFTPWVWKKDGIMAVSCQYMSVSVKMALLSLRLADNLPFCRSNTLIFLASVSK